MKRTKEEAAAEESEQKTKETEKTPSSTSIAAPVPVSTEPKEKDAENEDAENEEDEEDTTINEDYKIWKKNTPFLYDLVMTHALDWPSLTVEWLPDVKVVKEKGYSEHRMILGTHTAKNVPNFLLLARVRLPLDINNPSESVNPTEAAVAAVTQPNGGYGVITERIEIIQRIAHDGEVNRARYMPQNPSIIATKAPPHEVRLFDLTRHPSEPDANSSKCSPEATLSGISKDGYGLAWSHLKKGFLASSCDDGVVLVWDTNVASKGTNDPLHILKRHSDICEEIAWHCSQENIIGSVGDDKLISIWDLRDTNKPKQEVLYGHGNDKNVNAISFNPFNEFVFATGGSDGNINLWDLRNLTKGPVHVLKSHKGEIFQVSWNKNFETILASSSTDRRVMVWDLSKIGDEQTADEAEDGPPELLFVHGGHTARVSEFSWNSNDHWTLASVADDNILQVWQMAQSIYAEEDTVAAATSSAAAKGNLE